MVQALQVIELTSSLHLVPLTEGVPTEVVWRSLGLSEEQVQPRLTAWLHPGNMRG